MRLIGANQNDFDLLLVKKYIIQFEDGICVIKHWRIHNYIQSDRYHETCFKVEKSMLYLEDSKAYTLEKTDKKPVKNKFVSTMDTRCIQNGSSGKTRLGKTRIDKDRIDKTSTSKTSINKAIENINNNSSGSSDEFNIYDYFQQRGFVSISPMMYEDINTLIEMYSLEEVKQAVDIADHQGKHTLSYVKGILQHRRADGSNKRGDKGNGENTGNNEPNLNDFAEEHGFTIE